MRLDEKGVQLRTAVGARHYSGKAGDDAVAFCDEDAARPNLLDRQRDRVGVREKRVAITGIVERRTPLQRLEHRLLVGRAGRMKTSCVIGPMRSLRVRTQTLAHQQILMPTRMIVDRRDHLEAVPLVEGRRLEGESHQHDLVQPRRRASCSAARNSFVPSPR
jgi:hypothetical protein